MTESIPQEDIHSVVRAMMDFKGPTGSAAGRGGSG
jgi:hypothetical protein